MELFIDILSHVIDYFNQIHTSLGINLNLQIFITVIHSPINPKCPLTDVDPDSKLKLRRDTII